MSVRATFPRSETERLDAVVITTAALPWQTGPAFFSLWHASGLADLGLRTAYGVPWLAPGSQKRLWGTVRFSSPDDQARWLAEEARRLGAPPLPDVFFYRGYFSTPLYSIVPLEDVFAAAPPARAIVLQEPEHLCWYPFTRPRKRVAANKVIGVVMTNYGHYIRASGWLGKQAIAGLVERYHGRLMRKHTDLITPLTSAVALNGLESRIRDVQVTGVLAAFAQVPPVEAATRGVYFLGRLVWDKGFATLIEVSKRMDLAIDVFGDGPDAAAIKEEAKRRGAPLRFLGPTDSPWERLRDYRVFFNPSLSEVLCTATAESLVAGRHAVMPDCLGNRPFFAYPNAHAYHDLDGAVAALEHALTAPPEPPSAVRHDFDWTTACRTLAALF